MGDNNSGFVPGECLTCFERNSNQRPCKKLQSYSIALHSVGDLTQARCCPFRPAAAEIKSWVHMQLQGVDPNATQEIADLKKATEKKDFNVIRQRLCDISRDTEGHIHHFYYKKAGGMAIFLRRTQNYQTLNNQLARLLDHGLTPEQKAIIRNSTREVSPLPVVKSATRTTNTSGNMIPAEQLTVDNCGIDWGGIKEAYEKGGTLLAMDSRSGMIDPNRYLDIVRGGLGRIYKAAKAATNPNVLRPKLAQALPKEGHRVDFALEIAKGIGLQFGMLAGAAAVGAVGGGVLATFFLPELGIGAAAVAGSGIATAIFNYVMTFFDIKGSLDDAKAQNDKLQKACQVASRSEAGVKEATDLFADVLVAILILVTIAILAKALERGVKFFKFKNEEKYRKGRAYLEEHESKPRHEPHGAVKPKLLRGALGFMSEHLFGKKIKNGEEVHLTDAEFAGYRQVAADGNMIALRAPDEGRLQRLRDIPVAIEGKSEWIKQKSKVSLSMKDKRFHQLVVFEASEIKDLKAMKKHPVKYDMANLGPAYKDLGKADMFELPKGLDGIDYEYVKRYGEKPKLVQIPGETDKYMLVGSLGNCYTQDIDIAHINGINPSGKMEPVGGQLFGALSNDGRKKPDSFHNEDAIDRAIQSNGGKALFYRQSRHGGGGGSPLIGTWKPYQKDKATGKTIEGKYLDEKVIAFIPHGSRKPREVTVVEFDGWKEYVQFMKDNGVTLPY